MKTPYSDRTISIAKLNAKIYSQRVNLINYENLVKEKNEQIKKLQNQLKMAMNGLFEICNNPSPDFNRILYAREVWHKVKEFNDD